MSRIRTIILEDKFFDQEAIINILNKIPEYHIVGLYKFPLDALHGCLEKKPGLVIVDAKLHGDKDAGPNWVRNIKRELPNVCILGITNLPECVEKLRQAGCDDVRMKDDLGNIDEMVAYLKEARFRKSMENYVSVTPPELNEKEDQVMELLREGYSEKEMARIIFEDSSKIRRIKSIKKDLFKNFIAHNSLNLVARGYDTGYFKPRFEDE